MCPALERCVTFSKQYPQIISTLHKWSVTRDDLWPANLFQSIFWDFKSIDDPAEISFGQTSLIDIENSLLTKMSTSWANYLNDQYYDANVWALWPACFEASSGDYDGSRGGWAFTSSGQAVELTTLLVSAIVRCRAALVSVGIQIADHELTPPADLPISQTAAAYLGTSATPEAVYGCAKVLDLLLKKRDSINLASSEHAQEWDPIKQLLLENFTLLTCAAFERVIFFGMLSARALVRVAASDSSLMLPLATRRHLVGALRYVFVFAPPF